MNTFDLTLDLSKQVSMEPLRLRQGDKSGTTVRATVYDHGELVSGSYTARIAMRHPGTGATYYRETGTFSNGVATFTIDEQYAATVTGRTTGYVQLLQGSTVIASTADFPVVILRDATEGAVPGEVYDSAIEDALAELDEATGRISVMVQEQVAEELAAHPEWTTTVTDNSVTDAKLVQTGGILSRVDRLMYRLDNLLTGDTGEQEVAVVADAAATPVAGLSVYGRSVQDGTPTPDAPVPIQSVEGNLYSWAGVPDRTSNGITWTVNADGSFHASGTATDVSYGLVREGTTLGSQNRPLLPAGTYTASSPDGATFEVRAMPVGGGENAQIRAFNKEPAVFTLAEASYVYIGIRVASGATVDTDYHVTVYRGSVALPYVPYGHAGLLARGANLVNMASTYPYSRETSGVTFDVNADGTITVNGTATGNAWSHVTDRCPKVNLAAGTYTTYAALPDGAPSELYAVRITNKATGETISYIKGARTFTLAEPVTAYVFLVCLTGTVANNDVVRIMLVRGSTAQPYQPYVESVTPVPLGGHALRSLPDGTRDEVTVDERGHAVLVQRVGEVTLDGSETWTVENSGARVSIGLTPTGVGPASNSAVAVVLCDHFVASSPNDTWTGSSASVSISVGGRRILVSNGTLSMTASTWTAWLAENPTTVLYALATPVTHDLGYVDPVALTSPDATLQAVTGIATTFRADYERDLNTTLARLEAAIATLA